jgi:hypothetical protein
VHLAERSTSSNPSSTTGYPVATLASVEQTKLPLNYHWRSETPDALSWHTVENAIDVCEQFVRARPRT